MHVPPVHAVWAAKQWPWSTQQVAPIAPPQLDWQVPVPTPAHAPEEHCADDVHAVPFGARAAQAFPLQPYGQVVWVPTMQPPAPLQESAVVTTPPVQLWTAPLPVPAVLLLAFAQTDAPDAQEVVPFSHGLPVLQLRLGVQVARDRDASLTRTGQRLE